MEENERSLQLQTDKNDYIDIPAFLRAMLRCTRRYLLLVLPLVLVMTVFMGLASRVLVKKTNYVAVGTFLIGMRLSNSASYVYTFSDAANRSYLLSGMAGIFQGVTNSEYMTSIIREEMGLGEKDTINGTITLDIAGNTNMAGIYVVSDSLEDAETIRDIVFENLPSAVFSSMGPVELDVKEWYSEEEEPSRQFLTKPLVWGIGGLFLGAFAYLGLIFLYTLQRRDIDRPETMAGITEIPCLGDIPAPGRESLMKRKKGDAGSVMTEEYLDALASFRRGLAKEIREKDIRVLLFIGCGHESGQGRLLGSLADTWNAQGKEVLITDLGAGEGPVREAEAVQILDACRKKADLVLVDGPAYGGDAGSLVMADLADAMVLVIPSGYAQEEQVRDMITALQYANARPLGFVLNNIDERPIRPWKNS